MLGALPDDLLDLVMTLCSEGGRGPYVRATSSSHGSERWLYLETRESPGGGTVLCRRLVPSYPHEGVDTGWLYEPLLHVLPLYRPALRVR